MVWAVFSFDIVLRGSTFEHPSDAQWMMLNNIISSTLYAEEDCSEKCYRMQINAMICDRRYLPRLAFFTNKKLWANHFRVDPWAALWAALWAVDLFKSLVGPSGRKSVCRGSLGHLQHHHQAISHLLIVTVVPPRTEHANLPHYLPPGKRGPAFVWPHNLN